MNPLFFGSSKRRLYGAFHSSSLENRREHGVLLCYPWGHEYRRIYFAYKQLASMLSKSGFDVLRFDYFGTGDSDGFTNEVTFETLKEDTEIAFQELKDMGYLSKVSVVGARLGATILSHAIKEQDIFKKIYWDPIFNCKVYLEELITLHRGIIDKKKIKGLDISDDYPDTYVGFTLSQEFQRQLKEAPSLVENNKNKTRIILSNNSYPQEIQDNFVEFSPNQGEWNNINLCDQSLLLPQTILRTIKILEDSND